MMQTELQYSLPTAIKTLDMTTTSPISVAGMLPLSSPGLKPRIHQVEASKMTVVPDLLLPPRAQVCLSVTSEYRMRCDTKEEPEIPPSPDRASGAKQTTTEKPKRRRIFERYWETREKGPDEGGSKDSKSEKVIAKSSRTPTRTARGSDVSILQFSPPPGYRPLREHHELLENVVEKRGAVPASKDLPALPHPLRRLVEESVSSKSCGMYPLTAPQSILRQSKYAMRESSESSDESGFDEMAAAFSEDAAAHGLNPDLKQSIRKFKKFSLHKGTKEDERSSPGMEDPSSVVKFDPRITITEYTDEKERIWYSDRELNYFKNESLMLAQQYILLNPSIAEKFLKGSYDPVTGRLKKAALYSLPVLNCLPDDFDPETFNKQLQEMLDNGVKRILIVDPNNVILQLFSKMFHEMFPGTNVVTVESAEDALREYTMALVKGHKDPKHRTSFDIIVVEQKLAHHRRQRTTGTSVRVNFEPKDQTVSSTSQLQALVGGSPHGQLHPPRKASFSTLGSLNRYSGGHGMSGSQLIKKIRQLEDQAYGHIARKSDGETSKASESRAFQRCIIIGVSTSAREDSSILYEGGADLVWSKPPPPVGVQLRNQLLSALVTKRNGTGLRISQYNRTQSL